MFSVTIYGIIEGDHPRSELAVGTLGVTNNIYYTKGTRIKDRGCQICRRGSRRKMAVGFC